MKKAVIVLGDQLEYGGAAQRRALEEGIPLFMSESALEVRRVPSSFHRALFFLTAMRTFAGQCALMGICVYYQALDGWVYQMGVPRASVDTDSIDALLEKSKNGAYKKEELEHAFLEKTKAWQSADAGLWENLKSMSAHLGVSHWYAYEPSEKGGQKKLQEALPFVSLGQCGFIEPGSTFSAFAAGKGALKMEHYYRALRKKHHILMEKSGSPMGGQWNFDEDNRSAYPKSGPPEGQEPCFSPWSECTKACAQEVRQYCALEPTGFEKMVPVDRAGALCFFEHFVEHRLALFGTYQDAMHSQSPFGFHALVGALLNTGVLQPLEVCQRVQSAYEAGSCSMNSAEGFIRQVLGWREYMYGLYQMEYAHMKEANQWGASLALPVWFYKGSDHYEAPSAPTTLDGAPSAPTTVHRAQSAPTNMQCLKRVIENSWKYGYAHHIERLMVVGSFCTVAGIDPKEVSWWFDGVYQDALEWVQLPNVRLMALNCSDKGYTSKPYICSGAYIQKQGNDCRGCKYDPKQSVGERACPMSTLYWDFIGTHKKELLKNARMSMMVHVYEKMGEQKQQEIRERASQMRQDLNAL